MKIRKARKNHCCDRCGERIETKVRYLTWTWFREHYEPVQCKSHRWCDEYHIGEEPGEEEICPDRGREDVLEMSTNGNSTVAPFSYWPPTLADWLGDLQLNVDFSDILT